MKPERNILVAFLINLVFSVFELVGGLFSNSIAILSDSLHDLGDAISIGISYILEMKSKKKPDEEYTYGYLRYSILGAFITTAILMIGSALVIIESVNRLFHPVDVNYDGMIIFGIVGVVVNVIASLVTRGGDSLNQKSVNLHMLEDVFGWIVVLAGSVLMKFTDVKIIDPIMSIAVSLFIFVSAVMNLQDILDLFLVRIPKNVDLDELKKHILSIEDVENIHHIHIWSMDNINNYATLHIVTNTKNIHELKHKIREEFNEFGINHVTIEIEENGEECECIQCDTKMNSDLHHHHHHH